MKHFNNDRPRFAPYGFSCETWKPQAMSRADQHDEVELNYLTEGSLTYLMGGRRVLVPAQRLAVFWATVPHQIVEHEGESPYYVATIPFAWFLKWAIPSQLHTRILHWEMVVDSGQCEPERLECDLTVTRSASEENGRFPRLRFGLLSNAKVDAKRPIFRLVLVAILVSKLGAVSNRI